MMQIAPVYSVGPIILKIPFRTIGDEHYIRGIIGESNIWQFALKMQLARFLFGGFEYCMERNPCLQPKWHTFNLAIFT